MPARKAAIPLLREVGRPGDEPGCAAWRVATTGLAVSASNWAVRAGQAAAGDARLEQPLAVLRRLLGSHPTDMNGLGRSLRASGGDFGNHAIGDLSGGGGTLQQHRNDRIHLIAFQQRGHAEAVHLRNRCQSVVTSIGLTAEP